MWGEAMCSFQGPISDSLFQDKSSLMIQVWLGNGTNAPYILCLATMQLRVFVTNSHLRHTTAGICAEFLKISPFPRRDTTIKEEKKVAP